MALITEASEEGICPGHRLRSSNPWIFPQRECTPACPSYFTITSFMGGGRCRAHQTNMFHVVAHHTANSCRDFAHRRSQKKELIKERLITSLHSDCGSIATRGEPGFRVLSCVISSDSPTLAAVALWCGPPRCRSDCALHTVDQESGLDHPFQRQSGDRFDRWLHKACGALETTQSEPAFG